MFSYEYRHVIMDAISQALSGRASLYNHSFVSGVDNPEAGYRYMLAADVYDTLLPIFGTAMTNCPTLADATRLSVGELYCEVYLGLTGRTPKQRDCASLERLEQELLVQ